MKVYGFTELSEDSAVIEVEEVDPKSVDHLDGRDRGEVVVVGLDDGRWFQSFSAAKMAAVRQLQADIEGLRWALRHIRNLNKENVQ